MSTETDLIPADGIAAPEVQPDLNLTEAVVVEAPVIAPVEAAASPLLDPVTSMTQSEPILFAPIPRPATPNPHPTEPAIEPNVMMELIDFRRICRQQDVGIYGVQFQIRPERDDDEIAHHGHVSYDIRYLDGRDQRIYVAMRNEAMANRILIGKVRLFRATVQEGPVNGMYFWSLDTDSIVRLSDSAPETEGTVLDIPTHTYVVGG
jgi:hypothetical protein